MAVFFCLVTGAIIGGAALISSCWTRPVSRVIVRGFDSMIRQVNFQVARKLLIRLAAVCVAYSVIAGLDTGWIIAQSSWSSFERLRLRAHAEVFCAATLLAPPVLAVVLAFALRSFIVRKRTSGALGVTLAGVLLILIFAPLHHGGRLLDASFDGDMPPGYTMNYLRGLVLDAEDCGRKVVAHENAVLQGSRGNGSRRITCEVPFAFGAGDTFAVRVLTDLSPDGPRTAFFVSGLGLTPLSKNQSAAHLIRKVPFNKMIEKPVEALGGLAARLFREGVLHEVWINLTDAPETSAFTTRAERISVKTWAARAHQRHAAGRGRSARSLFGR